MKVSSSTINYHIQETQTLAVHSVCYGLEQQLYNKINNSDIKCSPKLVGYFVAETRAPFDTVQYAQNLHILLARNA